MIISKRLEQFYIENKLPKKGGEDNDWFYLHFKLFSIKLPNPNFRKNVIHIHDVQHVLYDCDTSWKGESFISGWEIATGMWKHLPIGLFSISGMGVGLFLHPKEVYRGYKTGLQCKSLIDLKIPKSELLNLSISQLKTIIKKKESKKVNWLLFLFWCFVGEVIFLFPFLLLVALYFIVY